MAKDLARCGFNGKMVMKGDQEAALEGLLRELAKYRGQAETILEFSPVRDSRGNGLAEKGVQSLEGLLRTHLLELDDKLGCKLTLAIFQKQSRAQKLYMPSLLPYSQVR